MSVVGSLGGFDYTTLSFEDIMTMEELLQEFGGLDAFSGSQDLIDLLGFDQGDLTCDVSQCSSQLATCLATAAVVDGVQGEVEDALKDLLGESAVNDLLDLFGGGGSTPSVDESDTNTIVKCSTCSIDCAMKGSKSECQTCFSKSECSSCDTSVCSFSDFDFDFSFRALNQEAKPKPKPHLRAALKFALMPRGARRLQTPQFDVPYLDELIDSMSSGSPASCDCYSKFQQCVAKDCTLMDLVGAASGICPSTCGGSCILDFEALADVQRWVDGIINWSPEDTEEPNEDTEEPNEDSDSTDPGESDPEADSDGTNTDSPQPVDCQLMDTYNAFGECSVPCGKGVRVATKKIAVLPKNGGKACEDLPGYFVSVECNMEECPEETDSCANRKRDGDETGIDCGGPTCSTCLEGLSCKQDTDCGDGAQCFNLPVEVTGLGGRRCISNTAADAIDSSESLFVSHKIKFEDALVSSFSTTARETFRTTIAQVLGLSVDGSMVHIVSARPEVDAAGRSYLTVDYIILVEGADALAASAAQVSKERITNSQELLSSSLTSSMRTALPTMRSAEVSAEAAVSTGTSTTLESTQNNSPANPDNGQPKDDSSSNYLAIAIGGSAVVLAAAIVIAAVLLRRRRNSGAPTAPRSSWEECDSKSNNSSTASLETVTGEDLSPIQKRNPMLTVPKRAVAYPPTAGASHPYALTAEHYAGAPKSP